MIRSGGSSSRRCWTGGGRLDQPQSIFASEPTSYSRGEVRAERLTHRPRAPPPLRSRLPRRTNFRNGSSFLSVGGFGSSRSSLCLARLSNSSGYRMTALLTYSAGPLGAELGSSSPLLSPSSQGSQEA